MAGILTKKLSHIFLLVCMILPTIVTSIQYTEGFFDPTVIMTLPNDSNSIKRLGGGLHPKYLVIMEYRPSYNPFPILECDIYTRNRHHCKLNLNVSEGSVNAVVDSIYQVTDEKVIVVWQESSRREKADKECFFCGIRKKITTLDMTSCVSDNTFSYNRELEAVDLLFYDKGFDVIRVPKNGMSSRTYHYFNGNQISAPVPFPSISEFRGVFENFYLMFSRPVTRKHRSDNIIVFTFGATDRNISIDLVSSGGKYEKKLGIYDDDYLDTGTGAGIVTDVDESFSTMCWVAHPLTNGKTTFNKFVRCKQFDIFGNEKYKNLTVNMKGQHLIGVKNLKDGGVVLLDLSKYEQLRVVEVRPDGNVKEISYPLKPTVHDVHVVDFNEIDGTFNLAYVNIGSVQNVSIQKYSLPSKVHQSLL